MANYAWSHRIRRGLLGAVLFGCAMTALGGSAWAIGSTNYQINEDYVGGSGGSSSSTNYQAKDSDGDTAAGGQASGSAFGTKTGPQTTNEPTLSFSVSASSVNLGSLSTSVTKTGTAAFSVLNYTSYGYVVQIIGSPPDNGSHTLSAMSTAAASSTGTEQFGINLVANTSPATLGADPQQVPDNTFGFGAAASGYNTANTFKYVAGDVVASATKSSGQTTYTISYIANMANNTPNGSYSGNQTLVVTGTY